MLWGAEPTSSIMSNFKQCQHQVAKYLLIFVGPSFSLSRKPWVSRHLHIDL